MEPWLLRPIPGVNPVISHLLRGSEHIRGDVDRWFGSLNDDEIWQSSAGFHLKHLAGSTRRLCAYLAGDKLSEQELAAIALEHEPTSGLVPGVHQAFERYEGLVRQLTPDEFSSLRHVGRRGIPVTAVSLAIHIIEHGQRHVGQAITSITSIKRLVREGGPYPA